ncbi:MULTISPECIES: cupin domain-containing protein [unclassified Variovorax]|uniref:JmjC domain-containing protein n=1 Tax=unclassified Variovorax TaxID=663243 RepID=UPI00076CB705|nr:MULTISPECIES: cupin domain-containing protein [unclassified Variovorax]KWT83648.1 putative cytoplasmic protein [Variovorax sp. WDL1]PNG52094.1 50S ribosomal protein L16 3-hydroxylase [Variovorax sp. B4]PNG54634.1 50S ribosomal protein L16 3-hydroxylase [Variovorax sp. B2]VTV15615.1 50S ribosomal protein L16 arginine hydroxylase [Variovorax sp. WDL1]
MEIERPLALLGGLSASQFMRRHWQKKPLLVRQAMPGMVPLIGREALFSLAGREEVESRLIRHGKSGWTLKHGPFTRRALPSPKQAAWTLLVQGVDQHDQGVHELLQQFRFVPDARLDDLMISYASDTGGVGAHFDSYDVFLLQAHGRRRWSIGRQRDLRLEPGLPLKILADFEPEQSFVLEPGDMLYLPPRYAHDGVAEGGDCMTYSIGLRAPAAAPLGADLLARIAEAQAELLQDAPAGSAVHYKDPAQPAVPAPAEMPSALQAFAREAVFAALRDPDAIDRALGESMTEPKPTVWFEQGKSPAALSGVSLDRRTRMLYDARHLYINGESFRASGRDARLMRRLADQRALGPRDLARASEDARALLGEWCEAGWLHAE